MEPGEGPITGTIVYTAADLKLLRSQFMRSATMELWQSMLVMGGLGAIIGYGVSALTPWFQSRGGWFALVFAVATTTGWSWRLTRPAAVVQPKAQAVTLDEAGLRLTTDKADTLMRWPLFTQRMAFADHIALRTEDNTWVLLRPGYFGTQAEYAAAVRLIEAKVG